MNRSFKSTVRLVVAAALIAALGGIADVGAEQLSVTIATGRVGGLYYPVGGAICKLVNENRHKHGITCTVEITSGSVDNLIGLRGGEVQLGMAQSDWHRRAFLGTGPFEKGGPFDGLRSVFAVYVEHFAVLALGEKRIRTFEDLSGKRIYMGRPESGRRATMLRVMNAYGWTPDAVLDVSSFEASNQAQALCDDEFDALVYSTGAPSPEIREATTTCNAVLVGIPRPIVEKLVEKRDFYIHSIIPRHTYQGQSRDVPTLGLVATLVTSTEVEPEVIYQITKAFFENLDRLRKSSPVFSSLSEKEMVGTGLTAPLHEGAVKYFSEAGLK